MGAAGASYVADYAASLAIQQKISAVITNRPRTYLNNHTICAARTSP